MNAKLALKIISIVSFGGILFSGYLSYGELTGQALSCPASAGISNILGIPVCVYGLIMYIVVFTVAVLGLLSKDNNNQINQPQ